MDVLDYLKQSPDHTLIECNGTAFAIFCIAKSIHKHAATIPANLLNIVYSGKKILHTSQGDIEVCAGDAFFLAKGEYVMSEIASDEEYSCLLIFFDDYFTAKVFSEPPFKNYKIDKGYAEPFFKITLTSHLKNCADSLKLFANEQPTYTNELLVLKLKEIMMLVIGSKRGNEFARFLKNSLRSKSDLALFMLDNFDKDLEIEEFARLSGRSLSAFKSEFKKIFNETPMKWIFQKRLEKGRFLIKNLKYDVGLAAINAGFKSHAHFSRLYKQVYGTTPSA